MRLLPWLGLIAVALPGCKRTNALYCDGDTPCGSGYCDLATNECQDGDAPDAGDPDAGRCTTSAECTAQSSPICDDGAGVCRPCANRGECASRDPETPECSAGGSCVECLDHEQCGAARAPICAADGACAACESGSECTERDPAQPVCAPTGACVECYDHGDCDSGVCDREADTCVAEASVIYVDGAEGSDVGGCGDVGAPCETIDFALDEVTAGRATLRIASGNYVENDLQIDGVDVALVGPEARVAPANDERAALLVTGGATVRIDGLTLRNAAGTTVDADGLRCTGAGTTVLMSRTTVNNNAATGVDAESGCAITLDEATVTGNARGVSSTDGDLVLRRSTVSNNPSGGVRVDNSSFVIVNDFIVANGSISGGGSLFGGVSISQDATILPQRFEFNTVADNEAGDLAQARGVFCVADATVGNSIVYGGVGGDAVVDGTCTWMYSDVEGGVPGATNFDMPPQFVDVTMDDYHIEPGSPAHDAADPDSTVDVDFDGDPRPLGDAPDVGADEIVE